MQKVAYTPSSHQSVSHNYKYTHFSAGAAVVLGMKKEKETGTGTEIGTGGATENESVIENATEKIPPVGKVEDAKKTLRVGRGTRNAHENGKGTEITESIETTESTEIDTANLVSLPLIYKLFHPPDHFIFWHAFDYPFYCWVSWASYVLVFWVTLRPWQKRLPKDW